MTDNFQSSSNPQKENPSVESNLEENIPEQKDTKSKFAVISFAIGLSSLPIYILGIVIFLIVAFMFSGALPFMVLLIPILISFAGVISGIVGLGSKRWILASIGLVLSGLFLFFESWMAAGVIADNWDKLLEPIEFGN